MNYKLWILIIVWAAIILVLILGWLGFDLVSIVSNSMKHEDETLFIQFWKERGCDIECVKDFPISKGFQGGDLLIRKKTTDYKVGDILAYQADSKIIIHRLVNLDETQVFLKGDNIQKGSKYVSEEMIEKKFVTGKIIFKISKLGLVKASLNCWSKRCDYIDCIINGNCN